MSDDIHSADLNDLIHQNRLVYLLNTPVHVHNILVLFTGQEQDICFIRSIPLLNVTVPVFYTTLLPN